MNNHVGLASRRRAPALRSETLPSSPSFARMTDEGSIDFHLEQLQHLEQLEHKGRLDY